MYGYDSCVTTWQLATSTRERNNVTTACRTGFWEIVLRLRLETAQGSDSAADVSLML